MLFIRSWQSIVLEQVQSVEGSNLHESSDEEWGCLLGKKNEDKLQEGQSLNSTFSLETIG
jgi:hypothetical protein